MAGVVVLLSRQLQRGSRGKDVTAMKRALSRAGYGKWIGFAFTPLFGPMTVTLLKRFQKSRGLVQDGVYGVATHKKLAPYYDSYGAKLMNDCYHARLELPAQRVVASMLAIYNYCATTKRGYYTQSAARMSIVRNRWFPPFDPHTLSEDCSSSTTGGYFDAFRGDRSKDPNNLGFNGQGFTGTMAVHGKRAARAILGALGFYGYSFPYKHVVCCVGVRRDGTPVVFSWGSGLPVITTVDYRGDFSHWRTYI